jgi:hypothetical protein
MSAIHRVVERARQIYRDDFAICFSEVLSKRRAPNAETTEITLSGLVRVFEVLANGVDIDIYRGRTFYFINSTVSLAAFHQLEILCLHRCPPSPTD